MIGARLRSRAVTAAAAVIGAMLVVGVGLELFYAATHPGAIPWYRLLSFAYLLPTGIAFPVVSVAIIRRVPAHPIGWLFGVLALEAGTAVFTLGYTAWGFGGSDWVTWAWGLFRTPALPVLALALVLFPTGRLSSSRWRWLLGAEVFWTAVAVALALLAPWQLSPYPNETYVAENPLGWPGRTWSIEATEVVDPIGTLLVLASAVSLVVRWRRSTDAERQQVKWMGVAALVLGLLAIIGVITLLLGQPGGPGGEGNPSGYVVGDAIFQAALTAIPAAMGFAIVRYRLYDVDRLLSRTIAYGVLATGIAVVYAGGVAGVGIVVGHRATIASAAALTLVMAMLFDPLRARLIAVADRWVYGPRAAPYELLTRLGRELGLTVAPEEVLAHIAVAAGRATRSRGVRVTVLLPHGRTLTSDWGDAADTTFDLVRPIDDGGRIGGIAVAGSTRRSADAELLDRIAGLSTAGLRNLRLLADLEALAEQIEAQNVEIAASRRRLVVAADSERFRLQDEVCRRIEPRIDALARALPELGHERRRPEQIVRLGDQLRADATGLVEEIRALSRGVLPPILVDHGLVAALRALLRRQHVDAMLWVESLGRFTPAVETTAYLACRAAILALAAGPVRIAVSGAADHLRFDVATRSPGHDVAGSEELAAAADRVVAIGGYLDIACGDEGTSVTGTIPLSREGSGHFAEEGEHGPDAPVEVRLLGEVELLEDGADVLLDRPQADAKLRADGRVAHPLGHGVENVPLAGREPLER